MSSLTLLNQLLAAIDEAVHAPTDTQPGKVTALTLNTLLRQLVTGLASQPAGAVLTAPGGRAYRLHATDAGRLLLLPADGGLEAEVADFCALAGLVDETQQQALNELVISLKAAGVWDQLHALYPMVGGTAQAHALNLKDPRDADEAFRLTFYGAPAHSRLGVAWNGQDQYARTHYLPQAQLLPTSTHLAYYATSDDTSTTQVEMGCDANGRYFSLLTHFQGCTYFENSAGGQVQHPVATGLGFSLGTRERADLLTVYRDGAPLATATTPNEGFPGPEVTLGCRSLNYYSKKTCGLASIGAGLTPGQVAAYAAAVRTFQRALGREALG